MNVIILTKTFPETPEEWRGIFVKEQADAIATVHKITVIKCKVNPESFKPFFSFEKIVKQTDNYDFITISVSRSFPVYNQLNFIISSYLAILKLLASAKPDLIHCHYSYPAGVIAWLIKKKTGIPYIITEHSRMKLTYRSLFHKFFAKIALRNASLVIAVSNSLKKELTAEKISGVQVIPNVIKTEKFKPAIINSGIFTIGFLGSLNSNNKGLDVLLSACSELQFSFKLKVGGAGSLLDYYKDLTAKFSLSEKVVFLGDVDPRKINNFYSDLNLFVLPSRYETFGIVLVEALACGIPVVATRCGGPEDIINDLTGLLTEIGDPEGLRGAISYIHSDYAKYDSGVIRNFVKNRYGVVPFLEKINSLYSRHSVK